MGMSILDLYMANSIDNTAGKIREKLNTVRNKRKASAKRCIWEMMQNAKDVFNPKYGGVSIEFEIADEHTFVFRHNGLHFRLKDVTCLIQQVSSKSSTNEDENVTGMFGTGFISTHLIADVIDVKSVLLDFDDRYRNFTLRLDRSGSSKEELAPRIKDAMTEFAKLDKDPNGILFPFVTDYDQHTEKDFDTSFVYRIESESQLQLALLGINDLVNTLPVTMINLPTVKSVRVINRIEGTDVCYTCSRETKDTNVVLSTISNGEVAKKYLTYTTPDVSLSIEIQEENGQWYAVKRDEKLPVLLRDFPLIGSHQFYFPYFLNGFRFIPTEPRDDIQIHGDLDDKPSVINRGIIDKAVEAALIFNQWLIEHNIHNRYLLASSRIPKSTESWDEETSEPWIKELQKKWRADLLKQTLLECENDNFAMSEMLLPDCSKKESREKFWEILCPVVERMLPKKEHIHEWREIMVEYDSWNCSIKYPIEKFLEDLASKTSMSWIFEKFNSDEKAAFAWLNEVIKFTYEELGSDAFENYPILPNQNGNFKKASELRRDNSQPIPSEIKEAYRIAFDKNIEDKLLNSAIDVTYVMSLNEYNLSSITVDLNGFIKDNTKTYTNRRDVSYYLTKLYSGSDSEEHRKAMNYICSGFSPKVNSFSRVDNVSNEMWLESDKFLLSYIPRWIVESHKCESLSAIGTDFLKLYENINETIIIDWLNKYLKLCTDIQCTTQLSTFAIFPNQKGNLKKIGELSYDNNIPEEIKDLSETANTEIKWRSSLLHKCIDGYSMHSPKSTSDIYRSISDTFDKSTQQLLIAKHAIALNYNNNPDISYIYSVMDKIYDNMPIAKGINNAEGFDWEKFIACAIVGISGEISTKVNVHTLCNHLSTEDHIFDTKECISWVDKFLTFALNYRGGRYKTKVTELDNHGIWVNQSEDFCMFSVLYRDGGIAEPLKDLAANNPIVNFNYRDILVHNESIMSSAIDNNKVITQNAVLTKIDNVLEAYKLNKQNPEFRSLIFRIMELDKQLHISEQMKYYNEKKDTLIVGSLGEGDTMNLVAGIIQQGDDKIKAIKEILEENSLDDLNNVKEVLKGCPPDQLDKVKYLVEQLSKLRKNSTESSNAEEGEKEIKVIEQSKPIKFTALDRYGHNVPLTLTEDDSPYGGLSYDQMAYWLLEAKKMVREQLEPQGYVFTQGLCEKSYCSIYGVYKDGIEIPMVVHSYLSNSRPFALNAFDWDQLKDGRSQLWVRIRHDRVECIPFYALPQDNQTIAVTFRASNIEKKDRYIALAHVMRYFKGLHFNFGTSIPSCGPSPKYFNNPTKELDNALSIEDYTSKERIINESFEGDDFSLVE